MEQLEKKKIYGLAYVLLLVVASLPLACEYIMNGGNILAWLARIEEIVNTGSFSMYPTAQITVIYPDKSAAVNSNLLLFFPALLRKIGFTITSAYRIYMFLLQILTVVAVRAFFRSLFKEEFSAYLGTVLFITCPYRIYVSYDVANLGEVAAWAMACAYAWGVLKVCQGSKNWKVFVVAILALAGTAYADIIIFAIVSGISLLSYLINKKLWGIPLYIGGCVLAFPALIYVLRYLVRGNLEQYQLPLGSIMDNGYTPGQLLTSFAYRSDVPGIGIGLFGALVVLCWLMVIGEISFQNKAWKWNFVVLVTMFFCATVYFPWDMVQRVAGIFLRFVGLIESPNVFMGVGCFFASIPAAYAVRSLRKKEGKFLQYGIPMLIVIAAIGAAIWHCNTLTYMREPMFLVNTLP